MFNDSHEMFYVWDALWYNGWLLRMMFGLEESQEDHKTGHENKRDWDPEAGTGWDSWQDPWQYFVILSWVHGECSFLGN